MSVIKNVCLFSTNLLWFATPTADTKVITKNYYKVLTIKRTGYKLHFQNVAAEQSS